MNPTTTNSPVVGPEIETVFRHAQRLTVPLTAANSDCEGKPHILVPAGFTLREVEGWRPRMPGNIRQAVQIADLGSFLEYVEEWSTEATRVFVETGPRAKDGIRVVAVLDYHANATQPSWCEHQAIWLPQTSLEWDRWLVVNGKQMGQTEFAQFLEDNTAAVVKPAGADLLQIVNHFQVSGQIVYQKSQQLSNGAVRFTYTDERKATGGLGEVDVPERLTLAIPVFHRGVRFEFEAKLRYRLGAEGKMTLWIEMVNPDLIWQAAVEATVANLAKSGMKVTIGKRL